MQVYRFGDPLNEASEVYTQSVLLGLKLSGLVIIVTAVIYAVENYKRSDAFTQEMDWHDALYFTVVTLSTVSPSIMSGSSTLFTFLVVFETCMLLHYLVCL